MRRKETLKLQKSFVSLLTLRPQILQKCSFHGIILAKEILSKAREEINEHCVTDLAHEIKYKQAEIDSIKEQDEKAEKITPSFFVSPEIKKTNKKIEDIKKV